MAVTDTSELIGYIYYAETLKYGDVRKNGESLVLNHIDITSHTDAEIIAAKKPLQITYTANDMTLKGMYVPIEYAVELTHVPASIFLNEASNVRDLIDAVQNNLDTTKTTANEAKTTADAVAIEEEYDRQHAINSYGGRSLASVFANEIGSTDIYTWLRNRARNANFAGLRIGDYIDVPVSEGDNVPSQTVRYRIGAIDQYYNCGDTAKGHHIVMVPLAPVAVKGDKASNTGYLQWRETNDNNGTAEEKHPYLCSKLHDWEINDFLPALPSTLQSAILSQRVLLEERYSSSGNLTEASGWSWADLGKIWSPSEMEVYGCPVWGGKGYSVGFDSQFPIFTDTASRIAGGRVTWWLRSVMGGSSSDACYVSGSGLAYSYAPTHVWIRPLPCFLLG